MGRHKLIQSCVLYNGAMIRRCLGSAHKPNQDADRDMIKCNLRQLTMGRVMGVYLIHAIVRQCNGAMIWRCLGSTHLPNRDTDRLMKCNLRHIDNGSGNGRLPYSCNHACCTTVEWYVVVLGRPNRDDDRVILIKLSEDHDCPWWF
jgi:hypothetical protein